MSWQNFVRLIQRNLQFVRRLSQPFNLQRVHMLLQLNAQKFTIDFQIEFNVPVDEFRVGIEAQLISN